jgi:flagella basal body P-ring formation protein FlgA
VNLTAKFTEALAERIPGAEIRIPSLEKLCSQAPLNGYASISTVRLVEDRAQGVVLFEINGSGEDGTPRSDLVQTPYSAWKRVLAPVRRIYPNTKLKNEDFKSQEVNVASGSPREYRGVMLSADTDLSGFQSRQTILENQFVTTTSVEKQPDLRKGDIVRLDLVSGDLTLSTQATVSEPGSIGERIRVLTAKSKKEVVGTVREDHSVEVKL